MEGREMLLLLLLHLLHGASTREVHRREEEFGRIVVLTAHAIGVHSAIRSHEERRRGSVMFAVVELTPVLLNVRWRLEVGRQTLEVRRCRVGRLTRVLHLQPLRMQRLTWPAWRRVGMRGRDGSQERRAGGWLHH